ncbi:MAG TPA: hypothetical protein VI893_03080 [Thermoplasmata archaeon]|nr:hypothetical protein [Thermoplasmata archaeon]
MEAALDPGSFIAYRKSWDFIDGLEEVKEQIERLTKTQPRRAVGCCETFIAACYEKANEIDDSGGSFGMFVEDLFCLWTKARLGTREGKLLSAMLHREQPEFCQIIDEAGMDPRCIKAHRFCTLFCALALQHAKAVTGRRLPGLSVVTFWDWACRLSRARGARIGIRASGYPGRMRRHALLAGEFDEQDAIWLCTTLSAFLLVVEGSH